MQPRVEIAEGTAFEVLLAAAAVADENWRGVFAAGPATYTAARATLGPDVLRRVAALGRFGWINLVGLVTRSPRPWDLECLVAAVRDTSPEDLHYLVVGGDRRQLLREVDEPTIRSGLGGDLGARVALTDALASDAHVLEGTPWLLTTSSADVHDTILDVLRTWRAGLLPLPAESRSAVTLHAYALVAMDRLAATTGRAFLDDSIGGVHYDPAGLDHVLAVSSQAVAPVIVVVDGQTETVILHPPLGALPASGADRLLDLGRAVGDRTRIRVLTLLRSDELTAVDLAQALGAPRTTLLHHLAILRSAGLIHVSVTPGGATLYRLRPEGFSELASAAAEFIPSG